METCPSPSSADESTHGVVVHSISDNNFLPKITAPSEMCIATPPLKLSPSQASMVVKPTRDSMALSEARGPLVQNDAEQRIGSFRTMTYVNLIVTIR